LKTIIHPKIWTVGKVCCDTCKRTLDSIPVSLYMHFSFYVGFYVSPFPVDTDLYISGDLEMRFAHMERVQQEILTRLSFIEGFIQPHSSSPFRWPVTPSHHVHSSANSAQHTCMFQPSQQLHSVHTPTLSAQNVSLPRLKRSAMPPLSSDIINFTHSGRSARWKNSYTKVFCNNCTAVGSRGHIW
jgi:hypothetical protein